MVGQQHRPLNRRLERDIAVSSSPHALDARMQQRLGCLRLEQPEPHQHVEEVCQGDVHVAPAHSAVRQRRHQV